MMCRFFFSFLFRKIQSIRSKKPEYPYKGFWLNVILVIIYFGGCLLLYVLFKRTVVQFDFALELLLDLSKGPKEFLR